MTEKLQVQILMDKPSGNPPSPPSPKPEKKIIYNISHVSFHILSYPNHFTDMDLMSFDKLQYENPYSNDYVIVPEPIPNHLDIVLFKKPTADYLCSFIRYFSTHTDDKYYISIHNNFTLKLNAKQNIDYKREMLNTDLTYSNYPWKIDYLVVEKKHLWLDRYKKEYENCKKNLAYWQNGCLEQQDCPDCCYKKNCMGDCKNNNYKGCLTHKNCTYKIMPPLKKLYDQNSWDNNEMYAFISLYEKNVVGY